MIVHGYLFIGIAGICLLVLTIIVCIFGDTGSISTDPTDPGVLNGTLNYMEKGAFAKYYIVYKSILGIGFVSGILGIILYLLLKKRPPAS